jgi:hypothetical protein
MASQRWTRVIITLFAGCGVAGLAAAAPAQQHKVAMTITNVRIPVFRASKSVFSVMEHFFCTRFSGLLDFVSRM